MEIPLEFIITSSTHNPPTKQNFLLTYEKNGRYGFLVKIGGYSFLEKKWERLTVQGTKNMTVYWKLLPL